VSQGSRRLLVGVVMILLLLLLVVSSCVSYVFLHAHVLRSAW